MKSRRFIYNVILLVAGIIFIIALYKVGNIFYQNNKQDQQRVKFEEYIELPKEKKAFEVDWDTLLKINDEIIGWIHIPDTSISYPLVQGSDNDFYLEHDYEKNYLYSGSIFIDAYADTSFSDKNTIIYGHNVYHGGMFSELESYMNAEFFSQHPYVYIFTPEINYRCEILGMYSAIDTSYSYQTMFTSDSEYLQYLEFIQNSSLQPSLFSVGVEDRIITLSTCSYEDASVKGLRYVVHARLVEMEEDYIE